MVGWFPHWVLHFHGVVIFSGDCGAHAGAYGAVYALPPTAALTALLSAVYDPALYHRAAIVNCTDFPWEQFRGFPAGTETLLLLKDTRSRSCQPTSQHPRLSRCGLLNTSGLLASQCRVTLQILGLAISQSAQQNIVNLHCMGPSIRSATYCTCQTQTPPSDWGVA